MLLYDIVNMERAQIEERSKHTKQPNNEEGRRRGVLASEDTLTQPEGNIKKKFSLKGSDDYQGLVEKYGAIEQGENPRARDVQVPRQTADGNKVSRAVRTVMEAADMMLCRMMKEIEKSVI